MGKGLVLLGSIGLGKEDGKPFVDSPKLLEGQGLGRKREFMKDFSFCLGPIARKDPLCQKVGGPFLVGEELCSDLRPDPCGAGQWASCS